MLNMVFRCIVTQLKSLLSDDVLHDLLDHVFPDFVLVFASARCESTFLCIFPILCLSQDQPLWNMSAPK